MQEPRPGDTVVIPEAHGFTVAIFPEQRVLYFKQSGEASKLAVNYAEQHNVRAWRRVRDGFTRLDQR